MQHFIYYGPYTQWKFLNNQYKARCSENKQEDSHVNNVRIIGCKNIEKMELKMQQYERDSVLKWSRSSSNYKSWIKNQTDSVGSKHKRVCQLWSARNAQTHQRIRKLAVQPLSYSMQQKRINLWFGISLRTVIKVADFKAMFE